MASIFHRLRLTLFHAGQLDNHRRPPRHPPVSVTGWAVVAPGFAEVARRYVEQVTLSLRPATVKQIEQHLRVFGTWLADQHPDVASCADLERHHIEPSRHGWRRIRAGAPARGCRAPETAERGRRRCRGWSARTAEMKAWASARWLWPTERLPVYGRGGALCGLTNSAKVDQALGLAAMAGRLGAGEPGVDPRHPSGRAPPDRSRPFPPAGNPGLVLRLATSVSSPRSSFRQVRLLATVLRTITPARGSWT